MEHLNINIDNALDTNPNIVIIGDLNQDLLNPREIHLNNILHLNSLSNIILQPTRITDHSSTLIDVILLTDSMTSLNADTIDIDSDVSDHKAICTYLKFYENHQSCIKRTV